MTPRPYHVLILFAVATALSSFSVSGIARAEKAVPGLSAAPTPAVQGIADPMSPVNPFNGGADATTLPSDARIAVFPYSRDQIFRVMTAPLKLTTIELAPGEKLISEPAMGDSLRWTIDTDGANNLYVKPSKPGLVNTLHINTNKREYDFTLVSSPIGGFFYQFVRFSYPESLMDKVHAHDHADASKHDQGGEDSSGPIGTSPDQLNFDYTVDGSASFKPLAVFDDGRSVWLRMPDHAPFAVPLVKQDGDLVSPNSITRGQYLIVQKLADEIVLVSGKEEVKIYRGKHRFLGVF